MLLSKLCHRWISGKVLPHLANHQSVAVIFANETEWLSPLIIPFSHTYNRLSYKANFVQFINDFAGLGVESGTFLQGPFKSFSHSFSAQAWIKCYHICRHNVQSGPLLLFRSQVLGWWFFQLSRSAMYWRARFLVFNTTQVMRVTDSCKIEISVEIVIASSLCTVTCTEPCYTYFADGRSL